jgi:alpha-amylase
VSATRGGRVPAGGDATAPARRRVRLVLALHFHQPVGNFDTVFRDAVRLSYRPLVEHVERHPGVRAGFHLSGCLLEWLETHDRPFLDRVVALAGSGQVEPLGGGFYEPILTAIPREDALDQIARLATWWKRRAGVRPRGAWIAERVWEPSLAEVLAEAGVQYTILDDQHLRFAGLLDERFTGVFVTERAARSVAFFPSDFALRYLIPFRPIDAVRAHLEEAAGAGTAAGGTGGGGGLAGAAEPSGGQDGDPILTYGDDAEKFGLWPETHAWVYGEGWLEKFFTLLEEPGGPALARAPGDVIDDAPPFRKVYVPNASYTEMLEWALPATSVKVYAATRAAALDKAGEQAVRAFVRGSLWDMFLARYPEADHLHKHVLWTSRRARALRRGTTGRSEAVTAALRAECNCAYWHGLFGGIYYSHLRHGLYHSVLDADARIAARDRRPVVAEAIDLDGDREREMVVRAGRLQAIFRPSDAGTMVELDDLETRFNVTNVLSRWKEAYHEGVDIAHDGSGEGAVASPHEAQVGIKAADLEGRVFDTLPLRSLRDFFCDAPPDPGRLGRFDGLTLVSGRPASWEPAPEGFRVRISRPGPGYERVVSAGDGGDLDVNWRFDAAPPGWFGTILCLSLLTPKDDDRSRTIVRAGGGAAERGAPGDPIEVEEAVRLVLEDRVFGFALEVAITPAARLIATPIETLQRAEVRYEAAYQGTMFALCWQLPQGPPGRPAERGGPALRFSFRAPGGAAGDQRG